MACDFFTSLDATFLLKNRAILFMGDSNTRALYKDLLWLVHQGNLIPQASLRTKNEESHANDKRLSSGQLTSGRNYVEVREYSENNMLLRFEFITQLSPQKVKSVMSSFGIEVDAIVINSCVWDLTRWGPNQVDAYKKHIEDICKYVSQCHPRTRLIWLATLPVSYKINRGFLKPEVIFIRHILPWHILEANHYTSRCCRQFKHDFIDLHYHTRGILQHRSDDGIHWKPAVTRYFTNVLLTHLTFCWGTRLPGNSPLDKLFMAKSTKMEQTKQNMQPKFQSPFIPSLLETSQIPLPNMSHLAGSYQSAGWPRQNELCTLRKRATQNPVRNQKTNHFTKSVP